MGALRERVVRLGARVASNPTEAGAEIRAVVNRRRFALTPEQWASWNDHGYIVLPKFFDAERMKRARAELDLLWQERAASPFVIDVFGLPGEDGTASAGRRMRFAAVDETTRDQVYKLNDVYLEREWLRDLALDPRLAAILSQLLLDEPVICNSLIFEKGSTQPLHFDTYYLPGRNPGGMTATWIALEDSHPDSGPLRYVPGSHKIPAWRNRDGLTTVRSPEEQEQASYYAAAAVRDWRLEETTFLAKEGDVFIWHEQLFHGGGAIADSSRTRRSLVTHYWRASEMPEGAVVRHRRSGGYFYARSHPAVEPPDGEQA